MLHKFLSLLTISAFFLVLDGMKSSSDAGVNCKSKLHECIHTSGLSSGWCHAWRGDPDRAFAICTDRSDVSKLPSADRGQPWVRQKACYEACKWFQRNGKCEDDRENPCGYDPHP